MQNRKLVSVITGTYKRPELIRKCIQNVQQQTYPNIEHCIVSEDLLDTDLQQHIDEQNLLCVLRQHNVSIRFVRLGRHWSSFLAASISAIPFQVAQWLSSGDYLMWLADDEEMEPDHIEKLVDLLEKEDVDFVYSMCNIWFNYDALNVNFLINQNVIGTDPPRCGQITNALYRVELLDYRGFEPHVGSGTDWDQIEHWMKAGASWAFLKDVTISHRVDKLGEGPDYKTELQPLRGLKQK